MKQHSPPVYIYELIDPRDGKTYYVGQSIDPVRRYKEHWDETLTARDTPKNKWLRSLRAAGLRPQFKLAATTTTVHRLAEESKLIKAHVLKGSPLTNVHGRRGSRRHASYRSRIDLSTQEFWDEMSYSTDERKIRLIPFRDEAGYGIMTIFDFDGNGWRHHSDESGFPNVWERADKDWWEHNIMVSMFYEIFPWHYERAAFIADMEPEDLGFRPRGARFHPSLK